MCPCCFQSGPARLGSFPYRCIYAAAKKLGFFGNTLTEVKTDIAGLLYDFSIKFYDGVIIFYLCFFSRK
ncbi:MAG: hypothetical protein BWK80_45930 [Desulfobacteraceae bacterium IS3]|nr:MAG: hypothetical protein BWK80_45930 [Desulfobacteraceae bacterium IS3]